MGRLNETTQSQLSPETRVKPTERGTAGQPKEVLSSAGDGQTQTNHSTPSCNTVMEANPTRYLKSKGYTLAMADSGANGHLFSSNVWVGWNTGRIVDMAGIDNHKCNGLPILTAAFVTDSDVGEVLAIAPEGAYLPGMKTILSVGQMQEYGCDVVAKPRSKNRGKQPYIRTPTGYYLPLRYHEGLPYLNVRKPMEDDWKNLPKVYLSRDVPWDPERIDHGILENWTDTLPQEKEPKHPPEHPYDENGLVKGVEDGTPPEEIHSDEDDPEPEEDPDRNHILDDEEPITQKAKIVDRRTIMAHVTSLVDDELTSETESETSDEEPYFGPSDLDREHHWEPMFEVNTSAWSNFDLTGRRRLTRRTRNPAPNYGRKRVTKKWKPPSKEQEEDDRVPDLVERERDYESSDSED